MSYLTVITLSEAKTHLRVDHTDSDNEITRMINSALGLLEQRTQVLVFARQEEYYYVNGAINVYDGPINSIVTDPAPTNETYYNYTRFTDYTGAKKVSLNVGYATATDVPDAIREAALEMIDYWYYKNDGRANVKLIPESVQAVIDSYQRFTLSG